MSLHLRSFIVLFFIGAFSIAMYRIGAKDLVAPKEFKQWRNTWLLMVSSAFLSFNFWIFAAIALMVGIIQQNKSELAITLYCALLFIVPPISAAIPGFGLMNYFVKISYPQILAISILLPTFLKVLTSRKYPRLGKYGIDILLIIYILLNLLFTLRATSFTDALRGLFSQLLGTFIPYFVISRTITSPEHFKKVLNAVFFAFFVAGCIGVFEYLKGWLLFTTLDEVWGLNFGLGNYLFRGESLRATSSFGHALVFSYVGSIVIGFYLYLSQFITNKLYRRLGWLVLFAAIMAPMSRGGWVSAIILYTVFLLTGKNAIGKLAKFMGIGLLILLIGASMPGGEKILNLIPYVGQTDTANIEYRQKIIEVSMKVIAKNPILGNANYREDPDMQELIQGEQIIDMLNTYMGVTLSHGLVGLFIFVSMFLLTLYKLYTTLKRNRQAAPEMIVLGRVLLSCVIATMFTIGSSGFGAIMPTINALITGLSMAYCGYMKKLSTNQSANK